MRIAALLFLVACGGSPKSPETLPPATSSMLDCGQVADHVSATVAAGKPRAGVTPGAIHELVASHCQSDKWTDDTKQCLNVIKSMEEGRACAAKMTEEQKLSIKTAAKALRKDAEPGVDPDEHDSDWVKHVVEEPGTKTR